MLAQDSPYKATSAISGAPMTCLILSHSQRPHLRHHLGLTFQHVSFGDTFQPLQSRH